MKPLPRSEENRLFRGLTKLFQSLIEGLKKGVIGMKELPEKTREFLQSKEVDDYLNRLIGRSVRNIRVTTARDWREAAAKGSNSRLIYGLMRKEMDGPVGAKVAEIISENVAYIKTLPQFWAEYAVQYAYREGLKGKRPEQVEAELRKVIPSHIAKNLKCIARTECAKAQAAITQARSEYYGIRCYFWRSVRDERSRPSHASMNGILVFYDDPPDPEALFPYQTSKNGGMVKPYGNYHAGNTFNCRCYQEPVVDPMFLPDTFRYYRGGSVQSTTKAKFLRQFGKIS